MKLHEVIRTFGQMAPLELAEGWDNVGLLCGDPRQAVKKVLITIDLTQAVLEEAVAGQTDLIMAYHPTIWDALKKIVPGSGAGALIYELIRHNIALYSMHTALDIVQGGINDELAGLLGISRPLTLELREVVTGRQYKLTVFLPQSDLVRVSEAIYAAGGGRITPDSNYSKCGFRTAGTGSFVCGAGSHPTIGTPGFREEVEELRFETVVPADCLAGVLAALRGAHSYEEPAFDVLALAQDQSAVGLGRWGELDRPVGLDDLIATIKRKLKVNHVGLIGPRRRTIRRAAVAAGSCGTAYRQALRQQCDLYLTGELKHHQAVEIQEAGLTAIIVNHSNSERFYLAGLAARLRKSQPQLEVRVSRKDRDPITWM